MTKKRGVGFETGITLYGKWVNKILVRYQRGDAGVSYHPDGSEEPWGASTPEDARAIRYACSGSMRGSAGSAICTGAVLAELWGYRNESSFVNEAALRNWFAEQPSSHRALWDGTPTQQEELDLAASRPQGDHFYTLYHFDYPPGSAGSSEANPLPTAGRHWDQPCGAVWPVTIAGRTTWYVAVEPCDAAPPPEPPAPPSPEPPVEPPDLPPVDPPVDPEPPEPPVDPCEEHRRVIQELHGEIEALRQRVAVLMRVPSWIRRLFGAR